MIPHPTTKDAVSCLTSEFGWDPVLSATYGRNRTLKGCKPLHIIIWRQKTQLQKQSSVVTGCSGSNQTGRRSDYSRKIDNLLLLEWQVFGSFVSDVHGNTAQYDRLVQCARTSGIKAVLIGGGMCSESQAFSHLRQTSHLRLSTLVNEIIMDECKLNNSGG